MAKNKNQAYSISKGNQESRDTKACRAHTQLTLSLVHTRTALAPVRSNQARKQESSAIRPHRPCECKRVLRIAVLLAHSRSLAFSTGQPRPVFFVLSPPRFYALAWLSFRSSSSSSSSSSSCYCCTAARRRRSLTEKEREGKASGKKGKKKKKKKKKAKQKGAFSSSSSLPPFLQLRFMKTGKCIYTH